MSCHYAATAVDPMQLKNLRKRMTQLMIQEDKYRRLRAKAHWYRDSDLIQNSFMFLRHPVRR